MTSTNAGQFMMRLSTANRSKILTHVHQNLLCNDHFEHDEGVVCSCGIYIFRAFQCGHKYIKHKYHCGASIDLDSGDSDDECSDYKPGGRGFCFPGAAQLKYIIPGVFISGNCKDCSCKLTVARRHSSPVAATTNFNLVNVNHGHVEKHDRYPQQDLAYRTKSLTESDVVIMLDNEEYASPEPTSPSSLQTSSSSPNSSTSSPEPATSSARSWSRSPHKFISVWRGDVYPPYWTTENDVVT